tara:strand:+ start:124 stop:318 length:195 start_codon:yes stop_codon:yes gene_type:complete
MNPLFLLKQKASRRESISSSGDITQVNIIKVGLHALKMFDVSLEIPFCSADKNNFTLRVSKFFN